ncbi:MAG: hypothetical protein WDW36_008089 [Sanguina aurantia]
MIDHIFAVQDPESWHAENLERNPSHYSWLRHFGPKLVCGVADGVGVGVHFNTLVQLDEQTLIKYGVVSTAALLADLTTWQHLYISGRLHKPVSTIVGCPEVHAAQHLNLNSALNAALLMLPPHFTTPELLQAIVGLSYKGDIRSGIAEDPLKVSRIVEGSRGPLEALYLPMMLPGRYGGSGS